MGALVRDYGQRPDQKEAFNRNPQIPKFQSSPQPPSPSSPFIAMAFATLLSLLLLDLSLIDAYSVQGNARRLSLCVERRTKSRLLGSSEETQESILRPVLVSGDYAGLSATFDITGKLIPVPEHLVPPALLEWGQAPSSLETLVSIGSGKRWTATILPETGCGVDNLQLTRTEESFSGHCLLTHDCIFSVDHSIHQQKLRVESYFCLDLDDDNKEDSRFRSRLALNIQVKDDQKLQIIGPISVSLERQVDVRSSDGTVGKGGGLDGRSVSRWLGPLSKMLSFAERDMTGVSWVSSVNDEKSNDLNSDEKATTLYLPGNLTLSYRSQDDDSQFQLETGQIHAASGVRHVIRRTFQGNELANVERWVERGEYITNGI